MNTKICFKCNIDKPLDHYYKHAQMADKHLNKCKDCTKKDTKIGNNPRKCLECNKEFFALTTEIKRGGAKVCSRNCYYKYQPKMLEEKWIGKRTYYGLHKWVIRKLGQPSLCTKCGTTEGKFEWANISGEYKEELSDWQRMCIKCHRNYDDIGKKVWTKRTRKTLTANGETKTIIEWSKITGLDYKLIHQRMNRSGWSAEKILELTKPKVEYNYG